MGKQRIEHWKELLRSLDDTAQRLTSGNVAHHKHSISMCARYLIAELDNVN